MTNFTNKYDLPLLMTSKIMLGAIIAAAFLAGTITTGTAVYAADHREAPLLGTAWKSILEKINFLQTQIDDLDEIMDNLNDDLRDALMVEISTERSERIADVDHLKANLGTNATIIDRLDTEALLLREDINTNATKIDELEARILALEGPIIP